MSGIGTEVIGLRADEEKVSGKRSNIFRKNGTHWGVRWPMSRPPRLTSKVFSDLGIWMATIGIMMGIAFPFFVVVMGVPPKYVITVPFFCATLAAGAVVGWINHSLSKIVVGQRLRILQTRMAMVDATVRDAASQEADIELGLGLEIPVDSNDELGDVAQSFNTLVGALGYSNRINRTVRDFGRTLAAHIETGPLVESAIGRLKEVDGIEAAAVCVVRGGVLEVAGASGLVDSSNLLTSGPVQLCIETLQAAVLDVPEDLLIDGGVVEFRVRAAGFFPIQLRSVPIGVLVVASSAAIDDETIGLIEQLLPSLGLAINQALSYHRLQEVAAIDSLTGILNRRFGMERLDQDFARSQRSGDSLGLLMIDIDHFKQVNDSYGHHVGDLVLREVAKCIQRTLRRGDALSRYGGEEFMAILPDMAEEAISALGERIRAAVEAIRVYDGGHRIEVTVSIGGCTFPSVGCLNPVDLVRCADDALYKAKRSGRNCLIT